MNDNSSVYNHYFSVLKFSLSITVRSIVIYLIYILSGRFTIIHQYGCRRVQAILLYGTDYTHIGVINP